MENKSKLDILNAACKLFSEKGYKDTTVREICKQANSYQISINYYFGSKENLYKEALLKSYTYTQEYNLYEKVKELSFEEKIKKIISMRVNSIFSSDKSSYFFKMVSHTENKEDPLLDTVFEQTLSFYLNDINKILKEEVCNSISQFDIDYCTFLLMVQALPVNNYKRPRLYLFKKDVPSKEQIDEFIEVSHISAMATLKELKKKYQEVKK